MGVAVGKIDWVKGNNGRDGELRATGKASGQKVSISEDQDPLGRINETQDKKTLTEGPGATVCQLIDGPHSSDLSLLEENNLEDR